MNPEQLKALLSIIQTVTDDNMDKFSLAIKEMNLKMDSNINNLNLRLDSNIKELNTKIDSIKWFILSSFGNIGLLIAAFKIFS